MGVALLPLVSPIVGYGLITVLSFLVMGVSTLFTVTILAAMQGADPSGSVGKGDGHGAGYGQLRPTLGTGGLWSAV